MAKAGSATAAAAPIEIPEGVSLTEGSVVRMHDADGEIIWIKVRNTFESPAAGPALTGYQYKTEACDQHDFMGTRSIPLDQLVDPAAEAALEDARKQAKRAGRVKRAGGPGICEHCGDPTGGGRFLAGHDAKLKSLLLTDAMGDDADARCRAVAESQVRAMQHKPEDPKSSKWWRDANSADRSAVTKLVKQGDGFLRSRIAQRTGADPGRIDEMTEERNL